MKRDPIITATINDLRDYKRAKVAIVNLREKLYVESVRLTSPRGATLSAVPTHSGGNSFEDAMSRSVDKKDEIRRQIDYNGHIVAIMERGLAQLTPEEREVITLMYINGDVNAYGAGLKMHCSRSQIYNLCDSALRKLSVIIYGVKNRGQIVDFS